MDKASWTSLTGRKNTPDKNDLRIDSTLVQKVHSVAEMTPISVDDLIFDGEDTFLKVRTNDPEEGSRNVADTSKDFAPLREILASRGLAEVLPSAEGVRGEHVGVARALNEIRLASERTSLITE